MIKYKNKQKKKKGFNWVELVPSSDRNSTLTVNKKKKINKKKNKLYLFHSSTKFLIFGHLLKCIIFFVSSRNFRFYKLTN